MENLEHFLDSKPLYYQEIDHERIKVAYGVLKPHIKHPRTVHIVGTNGKGSTGRIVAYLAYKSGLNVGHYSSPHIMKFNERIWLNGEDASVEVLETAHQKLFPILGRELSEALSYFEYTTLLALVVFEHVDLMVLEAGLGGEHDATNVCDKELSIITPIGLDHQAFLGDTISQIAATKIRSIQKAALIAPQIHEEVITIAKEIASEKKAKLFLSSDLPEDIRTVQNLKEIARQKGWGAYLADNAMVSLQALDIMGIPYRLDDLLGIELFGRFYLWRKNVRIDVGHNPLAASAIEKALDHKVVLIYNSLDDKDYEEVLRRLRPKVKRVEIIPIYSQRATTIFKIEEALQKVGLPYSYFEGKIEDDERYLVFGSFYVVEAFLKELKIKNEKLM
ncbi:MAG: bifunctional folylpolyglutamate synthase/dihydrofolate synthase [Campylobacterales bacterium]|nr:bifunctional folylpolyglutamate synthase/dihydrofolate synthase [Campylobacterales bacterium]